MNEFVHIICGTTSAEATTSASVELRVLSFWPADLAMMVEGKSAEIAAATLSCLLRNEPFLALLSPNQIL